MTPREASIFAAVVHAVVDPEPPLPPVAATDAVAAFERWLAAAPPLSRAALRALLYVADIAPRGRSVRSPSRRNEPEFGQTAW